MENKFIAIINWILGIVFFVTFAGVLVSDNLNGLIIGGGLFVLLLLGAGHWALRKRQINLKAVKWLSTKWTFMILVGIYQIVLLVAIAGETGFDSGIVKWAAASPSIEGGSYLANYFSQYPNNLMLMFLERGIYHISQGLNITNFMITLDVVNLVLIDIAIFLIALMLRKYLKSAILWTMIPLVLLISPWIIVVYSDTFVLPFVAGMVLLLSLIVTSWQQEQESWLRLTWQSGLLGIVSWVAYELKPTAIILLIAVVVELILVAIFARSKLNWKAVGLTSLLTIILFGVCQIAGQSYVKQQ